TVCDTGEPVFDGLFVEAVRIVIAEPVLGVFVIRVARISEGFELRIEAGDAAAIFRRRRVFAGDVARISQGRVGGTRLGKGELVFPAITHVIGVVEPRGAWPELADLPGDWIDTVHQR